MGGATLTALARDAAESGFNAARGFVGGATSSQPLRTRRRNVSMPHAAIPFRPHHRFAVPLPRSRRGGLVRLRFLAESRNISFPRRCGGSGERSEPIGAPMPHAALWVVQRKTLKLLQILRLVSMPHAALWVVQPYALSDWRVVGRKFQCRTRLCGWCSLFGGARWGESCYVSMPHAALWVVQHALFRPALCISLVSMPHAAIPFRPHHRFAVPLPRSRRGGLVTRRFLAESRNISFPRRCGGAASAASR